MIRSVDLTVWVILEDLKSSLPEGTQVQCGFRYAGTQSRNRRAAWVRRSGEGELRRYAARQKLRCIHTVKVRRTEKGDLRRYAGKQKLRCVLTVKVRGAIRLKIACHQLRYTAQ